jgi:transcriptional regulator with XRE-family HTH domain
MINRTVCETLRDRRLALGISQTELARTLGISVWSLNRIEHGKRSFDASLLPRLPTPIAKRVAYLLGYEMSQEKKRLFEFRRTGRYRPFIRRRPPGWPFPPLPSERQTGGSAAR